MQDLPRTRAARYKTPDKIDIMNTVKQKTQMRAQLRAIRKLITGKQRHELERRLHDRLIDLPTVEKAKNIGVYHSMGSELSLQSSIEQLWLLDNSPAIAFPLVTSKTQIVFANFGPSDDKAALSKPTALIADVPEDRIVLPEELDIILIPGIGFDRSGYRLGQGGGYYDRYLPRIRTDCLTIGIAFDEQIVDSVPHDSHDVRVNCILTPSQLISAT